MKYVWMSIKTGDGYIGRLCEFLNDRNLDYKDLHEIKEVENDSYKFFIYRSK